MSPLCKLACDIRCRRVLLHVVCVWLSALLYAAPLLAFDAIHELGWNDEDMVAFFNTHKQKFQELDDAFSLKRKLIRTGMQEWDVVPESFAKSDASGLADLRRRMKDLQLAGKLERKGGDDARFFAAKITGFLGHGTEKGFCFLNKPPPNVVADLDLAKNLKKSVTYYRLVVGRWYLYMVEE